MIRFTGSTKRCGGNTWITCCSGRRQTSKTSCSISGPTSTTISRITHWKGKRRIRPRHDHQPTSARFDGNRTVEPSIRPRWLPDLSKTRARCGISRPRQYFQRNHSVFLNYSAFRGISSFTPTEYGAIACTIGSRNNSPETRSFQNIQGAKSHPAGRKSPRLLDILGEGVYVFLEYLGGSTSWIGNLSVSSARWTC